MMDINERSRQFARSEEDLVREIMGMQLRPALYANGTRLTPDGEGKWARLQREHEKLPMLNEACWALARVIQNEEREDRVTRLAGLRVDDRGVLRGDDLAVVLEPAAWRHLEGYAPNGVVRGNVNAWLGRADDEVRFRTRHPHGGLRSGYAITSLAYTPLDVDDVARYAVQYLPEDARGVTRYDGRRAVIESSMASPFRADEAGVGMLHRIITEITSADDTSHALMIRYKAVRVACVNCTLITTSKLVFSHRHRTPELPGLLEAALAHAGDAMSVFREAWSSANRDTYRMEQRFDEREVFRRLVGHGHLRLVGEEPTALVDRLVAAWEREPGDTIAAVNRAITRAANDTAWTSPWAQDELEAQAGRLLFGKLRELPPLTRDQEEALAA